MVHEVRLQDGIEAILQRPITDVEFVRFDSEVYASTTGSVDERLNASFSEIADSTDASSVRTAISFYQVFYGREPDEAGLEFWTGQIEGGRSLNDIANDFATASEFNTLFEDQAPVAVVSSLYRNVLGREPDFEGLEFWSGQVQDGNISLADLGRFFATSPEFDIRADPFIDAFLVNVANGTQDYDVTSSLFNEPLPDAPVETGDISFTVQQDSLQGTDGADAFVAPIVQTTNGSGAVTNTFESGDSFTGGSGLDTLNVDLTGTVTGELVVGPAISTTSTGVENVFFRTQYDGADAANNLVALNSPITNASFGSTSAQIDAQNNAGVQQFWSVDGRADLVIEDIRAQPSTVALGFRDSDPGVSYAAFYDPASIQGSLNNSTLTLTLDDTNRNDLRDFPVDGVIFSLGGEEFQLRVDRSGTTNSSYTDFADALQAEIDADTTGNLDGVTVTTNVAANTIALTDQNGGTFAPGNYTFVDDRVPASGNLVFNQQIGAPSVGPVTQGIIFDGVGRGQEGGVFVAGSMGGRDGIETFDVTVDNGSWVQLLSSTNNILETVNIVDGDTDGDGEATGFLNLGIGTGRDDFNVSNSGFNFATTDDDRVSFNNNNFFPTSRTDGQGGITDVQTFDASGFGNELKVAARLTDASINKYLIDATDPVTFQYDLADAESNLTIGIDTNFADVLAQLHTGPGADSEDNVVNITGDSANDRINLSTLVPPGTTSIDLTAISIDGNRNTPNNGTDINTLELNGIFAGAGVGFDANGDGDFNDAGDIEGTAFNSVEDIDSLILAGGNNVAVNATGAGFSGLDEIVVKTLDTVVNIGGNGRPNATILNAEANTDISIDGGNQVLGGANGPNGFPRSNANADQNFGTISILNNPNRVLEVDLDNAANSNGVLTVDNLIVDDAGSGNSAVRTLNLSSNGVSSTSNVVNGIAAGEVSTLNFTGTQDLTAVVDVLGAEANVDVTISGEDLSGDLNLSVDGAVLNGDDDDQIIGTDGNADVLNLSGVLAGGTETNIREFETLNFVDVQGTFNATNVAGLDTVSINNMTDDLTIDDLANDVTVVVNDSGDPLADNDLRLTGRDGGGLTVNLNAFDLQAGFPNGSGNLTNGSAELSIADVARTTINVEDTGPGVNIIRLDLALDDVTPADVVDNRLQTVTINSTGNDEVTFLNAFANTLNTIDLSGIGGDTNGVEIFDADPVAGANDDTTIILNGEGGDFTLIDDDADATNEVDATDGTVFDDNITFVFTAVNPNAAVMETYTINNFIAFDGDEALDTAGASNGNRTVLDLGVFGFTSTADLDIEQVGLDTVITGDGANDPWQIVLTNTNRDGLGDENFVF